MPVNTTAPAASTAFRRGIALKVRHIMLVLYSLPMATDHERPGLILSVGGVSSPIMIGS